MDIYFLRLKLSGYYTKCRINFLGSQMKNRKQKNKRYKKEFLHVAILGVN